jgi:hypothetical protein
MHAEQTPSPEPLALIDAKGLSTVIEMIASYCLAEATKTNVAAQAHLADADRQAGRRLSIAGHKRGYEYAQVVLQLRGAASECKKHNL